MAWGRKRWVSEESSKSWDRSRFRPWPHVLGGGPLLRQDSSFACLIFWFPMEEVSLRSAFIVASLLFICDTVMSTLACIYFDFSSSFSPTVSLMYSHAVLSVQCMCQLTTPSLCLHMPKAWSLPVKSCKRLCGSTWPWTNKDCPAAVPAAWVCQLWGLCKLPRFDSFQHLGFGTV